MKRKHTHEESKERILKCAKKEFADRGFQGARMAEIAKKADVNKALIHYYFKCKDTLYLEVVKRVFGSGKEDIDIPLYNGKWELTPSQKLYTMVYFIMNLHLKAPDSDSFRIFFWEIAQGERYLNYSMERYTIPRHMALLSIIEEGISSGEFETIDPHLTVSSLFSFMIFYTINKKLFVDKSLHREIYKDIPDESAVEFTINNLFKSLRPSNKQLKIPEVPDDLISFVDQLIDLLEERRDEGISEVVIKHLDHILLGQ